MAFIKRDDALGVCSEHSEWYNAEKDYCCSGTADSIYQNICNLPTADVAEVVRCSECEYAHFSKDSLTYSCKRRGYFAEIVKQDDFCSYGERRD